MTAIDNALASMKRGVGPHVLYEAVKALPKPEERPALSPIEDGDPVDPEWQKVFGAWVRGAISDTVFREATMIARGEEQTSA